MKEWQLGNKPQKKTVPATARKGYQPTKGVEEGVKYPTPCDDDFGIIETEPLNLTYVNLDDKEVHTKVYCEKYACKYNSACCLTHSATELCICKKDSIGLHMNGTSDFICTDYVYESKAARCSICREYDLVESLKDFMEENTLTFEALEVLIETTKAYEGEL